jgi:hypothetical protein
MSTQSMFTTLRLTNSMRENGGEWYANTITDYHRRVLAEHQTAEPDAGWRLETRGLSRPWHGAAA